jgi:hypothetical protein
MKHAISERPPHSSHAQKLPTNAKRTHHCHTVKSSAIFRLFVGMQILCDWVEAEMLGQKDIASLFGSNPLIYT